ncbi:hypothetical protein U3A55_09815 [Salarchaeum sp. III]|uniref:hypothetical protein n=1 Tax=Salarchaeum sp. III TaxID=3107927 RepID=UPI002ED835A0
MGVNALDSLGVYTPRARISAEELDAALASVHARGVDTKAVAAADEDSVTMAHAAARDAIQASTYERDDLGLVAFATTTPPLAEGDVAGTLAELLGLPRDATAVAHTQSPRGGVQALRDALDADGAALAVAADSPFGDPGDGIDHAAGAGAVAFVAGPDGDVTVQDTASYTEEFPGTRYRPRGSRDVETYGATEYERDAYRTSLAEAVTGLGGTPDALAPTAPDGGLPYRGARAVEGDASVYERAHDLGDTGAASPLFGLLAAWDADETDVAVVGYGNGADAVHLDGALPVPDERDTVSIDYPQYARKRGHIGGDA